MSELDNLEGYMSKEFIVSLNNRSFIRISGADAGPFLQGLITNDIQKLEQQPLIYSCLLSPQGKFQHDFFIFKKGEDYILDCEGGGRREDLMRRLSIFKLRSKVELQPLDDINVSVGTGKRPEEALTDPRLSSLGWRHYSGHTDGKELEEIYEIHRLSLGVPNGSQDMIPGKSTLIESHLDKLQAVSFNKGCYMGQELTARMYYRGLAKKHLYPVHLTAPFPKAGDKIYTKDSQLAGEMRSIYHDHGLALLKDKLFDVIQDGPIKPYICEWMK